MQSILVCNGHKLTGLTHAFDSQIARSECVATNNLEALTVFQSISHHKKWIVNILSHNDMSPTWTSKAAASTHFNKSNKEMAITLSFLWRLVS